VHDMASEEARDEVTEEAVETVQGVDSVVAGWLKRVWRGEFRAEWAVAWYAFLLTALVPLVMAPVSVLSASVRWHGMGDADRAFPMGRWLLGALANGPWRGVFLGLGLVVLDRVAGKWRRPVRWAIAGALFPGLLAVLLPGPTEWRHLLGSLGTSGSIDALGLTRPWPHWLWTLGGVACAAAWGWWVARAVGSSGRPYGRLARAGMEASAAILVLVTLANLPMWLSSAGANSMSWREIWADSAFGLVYAALRGALNGLAIAIALWAGRPKAAVDAQPTAQ